LQTSCNVISSVKTSHYINDINDISFLQKSNHVENLTSFANMVHGSKTRDDMDMIPNEPTFFGNETQKMVSEISLQWLNKAAMNIVWPDQRVDVMLMTASKQFPDLEHACLFEGNPEDENSIGFTAAISGCMDSEETIVNLGVNNQVLELLLLKNGTTFQNTWNEPQSNKNLDNYRQKRTPSEWRETGGYIRSSQPSPSQIGVTEEDRRIPNAITFPLDLGYDKTLHDYFGSHPDVKRFIQETVVFASTFFKQPYTGLPTIEWEINPDIRSYFDISITADQICDKTETSKKDEVKKLRKGNSTPLMLFVEDVKERGTPQTIGCAFTDAACGNRKGEAFGIVDMTRPISRSQQIQHMARTMAHEFGHLIGMIHDFEHLPSMGCNGKGLMSYDNQKDTWSTCSIDDFRLWWRSYGYNCKEITTDLPKVTLDLPISGNQNAHVLRNLYQQLLSANDELEIDYELQEIAQRAGCVDTHDDHKHLDDEANDKFGSKWGHYTLKGGFKHGYGVEFIITPIEGATTCNGQRAMSPDSWSASYDQPANIWQYCSCQNKDWKSIKNRAKVGCSVTIGCGVEKAYCVLGGRTGYWGLESFTECSTYEYYLPKSFIKPWPPGLCNVDECWDDLSNYPELTGNQNPLVLHNLYQQLLSANNELEIDDELQEIAQRAGCVETHNDHKHLDDEANEKFGSKWGHYRLKGGVEQGYGVEFVITPIEGATSCNGQRAQSSDSLSSSYDQPANIWKYCSCQNKDWKSIINRSKVGCSVTIGCGVEKAYCVLGGRTSDGLGSFAECSTDEYFVPLGLIRPWPPGLCNVDECWDDLSSYPELQ